MILRNPDMTTAKIDTALENAIRSQPHQSFDLLVRVDRADDQRQAQIEASGAAVRRRLTLVPTFAVTCTGASALRLAEQPWVQRVEDDGPVYAL